MAADKIDVWEDTRVQRRFAILNGKTYGFLYGEPTGSVRGTVFLIHGFPDLSVGWRYQIPYLLKVGLRIVCPDMVGYGMTDAPPFTLKDYSYRQAADDIAELARQLGVKSIILGGHDWGGAIVYRTSLYYPSLVSHVFAVCTPYFPPNPTYKPLAAIMKGRYATLKYQQQLASGQLEEAFASKSEIKSFLNALYCPWGEGKPFHPPRGVDVDACLRQPPSELLSPSELEYYATQYSRHGLHGPLNWYRTREQNYVDELEYFFNGSSTAAQIPTIKQKLLFIMGTRDSSLSPDMTSRMSSMIPNLTRKDVDGSHWVLWEKPNEVNEHLRNWFEKDVFDSGSLPSKL